MNTEVLNILCLGDVVGSPGRKALKSALPQLKERFGVGLCVANGENAAGGVGLTPGVAEELLAAGIDFLTSGNHIWDKKEIYPYLAASDKVIRPANYPAGVPGRGWNLINTMCGPVGIINLSGQVFMGDMDSPFGAVERCLGEIGSTARMILVDFHAEATAEKIAMGRFLDGKVSVMMGTHTHVQTADERIFPGGTAYITDLGMCGPEDSILGVAMEPVLEKFRTHLPVRFEVAKGPVRISGVVISVDTRSGRALSIERISALCD